MATTTLHVVFAQRVESYPGEYAPEALAIIDEFGNDNNPDYLREQLEKARASREFESVVSLKIAVDSAAIMRALRPSSDPIKGSVLG